ncbi:MAG: hypothetical protein DRJ42_06580 [Deltaproteobacteria bacterium]|nr:MAG: hypothetical protein DRJ42_06580 [Deltaproteobacteria bacterium]
MGRFLAAMMLCASLAGCGDSATTDGGVVRDAGPDGPSLPVNIPWLERGVPDLALTPCPTGWREVVDPDGFTMCDAYPEAGPADCGFGEAHFPGEPDCRPIGPACPTGEWPEGLPSDESVVVFVRAGATGGDGSRAMPFGGVGEVPWGLRGFGWTVALAKGRYDGTIPMRGGVRVVGACAAETVLTSSAAGARAVVEVSGAGPTATLSGVAIVDAPFRGIHVSRGASLDVAGVLITNTTEVGLFVDDDGSVVEAADLVVTETQPRPDGYFGYGISVEGGPRFSGTRIVLVGNHDISLFAQYGGGVVSVTDLAIVGTKARAADGTGGRAINVQHDATLSAERIWLRNNRDMAFLVVDTSATLTDAVISDTLPFESDGTDGRSIGVQEGGSLTATRVVVSRSHDTGIFLAHAGTEVVLTDVVVRDTAEQESDGKYGRGINVQGGSRLNATRVFVTRSHDTGVFVSGGSTATLTDVAVHDTEEQLSDGEGGSGVTAQSGATLEATRLLVRASRENGLMSLRSVFDGRDVVVEDTRRSACDCPEQSLGYGAAVIGGSMTLDGFRISGSAICGLFVTDEDGESGGLDVRRGIVDRAEIGACVQVADYRLERLTDEVVYRDNGTNLDSTRLPVPEPGEDLLL